MNEQTSKEKISLTEAARIARGNLVPPSIPIRFDGELPSSPAGDYERCANCDGPISLGPKGWVHEDSDQMMCERAVPLGADISGPKGSHPDCDMWSGGAAPEAAEYAELGRLAAILEEDSRLSRPSDDWNVRQYRVSSRPAVILRLLAQSAAPEAASVSESKTLDVERAEKWIAENFWPKNFDEMTPRRLVELLHDYSLTVAAPIAPAAQDVVQEFWFNKARPIINAIGEISVIEAMDAIDRMVREK